MNVLKVFSRNASAAFDYRAWVTGAELELAAKQAALEEEFELGHWAGWNADLANGTLTFSDEDRARVIADVQIVGTRGRENWLWAWANQHLPEPYTLDSRATKVFGDLHKIEQLTSPTVADADLEALGWSLTAVAARLANAAGAYKAPTPSGAVYLLIKSIGRV